MARRKRNIGKLGRGARQVVYYKQSHQELTRVGWTGGGEVISWLQARAGSASSHLVFGSRRVESSGRVDPVARGV